MDIYVLSPDYKRGHIIDQYTSFLWTERYSSAGDVQVVTQPTLAMRALLREGVFLEINESDRLMVLETVVITKVDGKSVLTATGRSMESILEFRSVRAPGYEWYVKSTTGDIVQDIVWRICVAGNGFSSNDIIPNLAVADLSSTNEVIDTTIKFQAVYNAVKDLCDAKDLGFRITLKDSAPNLLFAVYGGKPRSVFFSTELDTLTDPSYLTSQKGYRNIAYVYGKSMVKIVAAPGTDINVTGLARRVLSVDASDVDPTKVKADEYINMLTQRGLEALAATKFVRAFDGKLPKDVPYRYNEHYFMGDLVYIGDADVQRRVRVVEYIWASDAEGDRSYPTFM